MNLNPGHPIPSWGTALAVLVALLIAFSGPAAYGSGTRIAVAAEAPGAEAAVSDIAARAPYILIFDASGKLVESQANPFAKIAGDAGPPFADWLAERQIGALVAGNFGSKLSKAMSERGIRAITADGSAAAAVRAVQR
jgi:predicted Fe-Mo cluster-binding NifX family protein